MSLLHAARDWGGKLAITRASCYPLHLPGGPFDASTNPPKQPGSSAGDLLPHLVLLEDSVAFHGRLDPVEERHFYPTTADCNQCGSIAAVTL